MRGNKPEVNFARLPEKAQSAISQAVADGTGVIFHAGCTPCVVSLGNMNTSIEGLKYCLGCRYMQADWSLPNKGINNEGQ